MFKVADFTSCIVSYIFFVNIRVNLWIMVKLNQSVVDYMGLNPTRCCNSMQILGTVGSIAWHC